MAVDFHFIVSTTIIILLLVEIVALSTVVPANVDDSVRVAWGNYDSQLKLAQFIDSTTLPDDKIIALFQPYLYYLADRAPAIPHFFLSSEETITSLQHNEVIQAINTGAAAAIVVTYLPAEAYILNLLKNSTIYQQVPVSFSFWYTIGYPGAVFLRHQSSSGTASLAVRISVSALSLSTPSLCQPGSYAGLRWEGFEDFQPLFGNFVR